MGTTCVYNKTVAEYKDELLKGFEFSTDRATSTIVDRTAKWALRKITFLDGRVEMIPIWLNVYRSGNATCEKLMDATCHPYRYDCPKKFLKLAKEFPYMVNGEIGQYFKEWLEKAEKESETITKKVNVEFGKTYNMTFGNHKVRIVGEYNKKCWLGYIDSVRYKIKKNTIKDLAE